MASALDGLTDAERDARPRHGSVPAHLSDAQRDAVTHRGSPLLVIGGPGTGKTEVLVRRLVWLADDGCPPHSVLVLSAQQGLRERIELALARAHEELAVYGVAEFCVSLLSAQARHAGIDPFVEVLGPGERLAMLLDRADELDLHHHDFRGRPLALFAGFVRRIDQCKAELIDAERYAAWAAAIDGQAGEREREFAGVFAAHDRMLEALGVFDEGGVLGACVALLRGDGELRERVAERYPELLVDDWQERSHGERELVVALERGGSALSAAGDDDQAVGRARGAGAANLLRFTEQRRGASVVSLSQCFRCPQRVLDAAHAVVARRRLADRQGPARRRRRRGPLLARRERARAGAARRRRARAADGARGRRAGALRGARALGRARRARRWPWRSPSAPCPAGSSAPTPSSTAPRSATCWPGCGCCSTRATPPRSSGRSRARRSSCRPPTSPAACRSRGGGGSTWSRRSSRRPSRRSWRPRRASGSPSFLQIQRAAAGALENTRADLFVHRLIEHLGLRRQQLFTAQADVVERLLNLARLGELAGAYERRVPGASAREFARHLGVLADAGLGEKEASTPGRTRAVAVMSIEAAAGLEFDHVFVLGLHATRAGGGALGGRAAPRENIPDALAPEALVPPSADERARRLLYVAMTRARARSCSPTRPARSAAPTARPSPLAEAARGALRAQWESRDEELFGPAEALHSIFRERRDELLATVARLGTRLRELRLDTELDVAHGVVRFARAGQARLAARSAATTSRSRTRSRTSTRGSARR